MKGMGTAVAEKDGIKYLAAPKLKDAPGVVHGFLSRTRGVSTGGFSSLNFDDKRGDSPETVDRNREIFLRAFGIEGGGLITMNQVHGGSVFAVKESPAVMPEADALVTAGSGNILGVLTADCVPILLYDPVG